MKGTLHKLSKGWTVWYNEDHIGGNVSFVDDLPLHPDDVRQIEECLFDSPGVVYHSQEVEFEMVDEFTHPELYTNVGWGDGIKYAKLIPSKEQQNQLMKYEKEYKIYMNLFVNSNLTPPTIEEYVDKVNNDSDFARYWGPKGKEMQKRLITEIMEEDAKDGLYEHIGDVNKMIEISDEQLENILHTSGNYDIPYHKDSIMSYGKICEHDDGYLCEHRRKYIIDLFKEREISDEEVHKAAQELKDGWTYKPIFFAEGAKWYREQLKQRK